jgi:hypothetical protein
MEVKFGWAEENHGSPFVLRSSSNTYYHLIGKLKFLEQEFCVITKNKSRNGEVASL